MKFGLVSAILDGWTMEEMLDVVSGMGFDCVEVACWPQGKAERRYAGVSHIDVARVLEDEEYAKYVLDSFAAKKVEISSLAFYPNTMDGDLEKRAHNIAHLKTVIAASASTACNVVKIIVIKLAGRGVELLKIGLRFVGSHIYSIFFCNCERFFCRPCRLCLFNYFLCEFHIVPFLV